MPRKQSSNSARLQTRSEPAQSTKPTATIRHGNLKATIWLNESSRANWFNVSLVRIFKDQNGFYETNQFNTNDLMRVAFLAQESYAKVMELKAAEKHHADGHGYEVDPQP